MAVETPKPTALRTWWAGLRRAWRLLIEFCGGLAVLIGLVLAFLQLRGALRTEPAPPTATVELRGVVENQSLASWHEHHPEWMSSGDPEILVGLVVTLGVTLDGLKGKTVVVSWRPTDANSQQPIPPDPGERRELRLRPEKGSWTDEVDVWVLYPAARRFVVKFQVEHDGQTLGSTASDVIDVESG